MAEKLDPVRVDSAHVEPAPHVEPAHLEPAADESEQDVICTDRPDRFEVGDAVFVRYRVVDAVPVEDDAVDYWLRLE